jgi:hypothetical protein
MKHLLSIFIILLCSTSLSAQDGSNIRYAKVNQLDASLIGEYIHIDFHKRSFGGIQLDTIVLEINNQQIKFVEHRQDNGYTNWFNEQYLQQVGDVNKGTMRIVRSRLNKINSDSIEVTYDIEYYDQKGNVIAGKFEQVSSTISKSSVVEILVKS